MARGPQRFEEKTSFVLYFTYQTAFAKMILAMYNLHTLLKIPLRTVSMVRPPMQVALAPLPRRGGAGVGPDPMKGMAI